MIRSTNVVLLLTNGYTLLVSVTHTTHIVYPNKKNLKNNLIYLRIIQNIAYL